MRNFRSKKTFLLLLSVLSGLLMSLAWPERGFPGLLFIGLVPLLFTEEILFRNRDTDFKFSVLVISWPGFFVWNFLTTWWIVNSTLTGAVLAIFLNSLFMSIVFQAFHWSRKKFRHPLAGYVSLISYWIAFEYLHLNWDLNWPWLNLGNGFASYYKWVQWYEFTGAFGGTLWVLVGNILVFELINKVRNQKSAVNEIIQKSKFQFVTRHSSFVIRHSLFVALWILAPVILSFVIYANYKEEKHPVNVVVVQPNLDPYSEQYTLPPSEVIGRIMKLASPQLDSNTNFLNAPESAIQEEMWENGLTGVNSLKYLQNVVYQLPGLNILVGASTFYSLKPGEALPRSARRFTDSEHYYIAYNLSLIHI